MFHWLLRVFVLILVFCVCYGFVWLIFFEDEPFGVWYDVAKLCGSTDKFMLVTFQTFYDWWVLNPDRYELKDDYVIAEYTKRVELTYSEKLRYEYAYPYLNERQFYDTSTIPPTHKFERTKIRLVLENKKEFKKYKKFLKELKEEEEMKELAKAEKKRAENAKSFLSSVQADIDKAMEESEKQLNQAVETMVEVGKNLQ